MTRIAISLALLVCLALPLAAQDDNSAPLGDVARALRKEKEQKEQQAAAPPQTQTVIDNDNFTQVMKDAEKDRQKGDVRLAFSQIGKDLQVTSPDVTCNLSFSAKSAALLSDPFVPQDLPLDQLAKLDGPAVIHGDSLEVTVYNSTAWTIKEITVGFTISRPSDNSAASKSGEAKLLPASDKTTSAPEKHSDLTVLYHISGVAPPATTTIFHQSLGATLRPQQDWHWAIVQAQGLPPR